MSSAPDAPARKRTGTQWLVVFSVIAALLVAAIALDPVGRIARLVTGDGPEVTNGAVVVERITRTAEFRAATGTYSVPVFLENEDETRLEQLIPDVLDGEQVVAMYIGTVDATIDLSGLTEGDITIDEAANSLQLRVPAPVLSPPNLDEEESRVVAHTRGLLPRLSDAVNDDPLDLGDELDRQAVAVIGEAAEVSDLRETARFQGEQFLTSLGIAMGFATVSVEFTG